MPDFYPEHVPPQADDSLTGYLGAAEWLLDEEVNRDKLRGWTREAIRQAQADCKDFQTANAADLETYQTESGRDMESAGHDFYLSRNGHGAGFFDRGNHPAFNRLQKAARVYGEASPYVGDGRRSGWLYFY